MVILGSPYLIVLLSPPWQARTTNFFGPPGVRLGLLQGKSWVLTSHLPHLGPKRQGKPPEAIVVPSGAC